jgi:hypothetical protein
MDETVVEDPELEAALEARLAAALARAPVAAAYREADKVAKALVKAKVEVGVVARVGRFRVERKATEARHVEFDAEAGDAVRIKADGDE